MKRKGLWLAVSGLTVLSLVMAACAPAATPVTPGAPQAPPTPAAPAIPSAPAAPLKEAPQKEAVKPASDTPKYGGTLNLAVVNDPTSWDPVRQITSIPFDLTHQQLWEGDWAKGPAGGYGTAETDWGFANNDLFDFKAGFVAESWKWTLDSAKDQGTVVYQIRRGIHWDLDSKNEASRLVGGREMTADDVAYTLKRATTIGTDGFVWRGNAELRGANITRTGPWEVTIVLPTAAMITGISRFGDALYVVPPEVITKYGDMNKWQNFVGTGPFMLTDYVPGSIEVMTRNPNFWMKDPVGPGKGNQLPYLDAVRQLIIPDNSTRYAAMRTGKIDQISPLNQDDTNSILKSSTGILEKVGTSFQGRGTPLMMRTDKSPFNDVRVRQALMMATDFQTILNNLYGGVGQILTYPFSKVKGYEELYVNLNDPDFPAAAKDLYIYNPAKAQQLLKDAGYPNGFKAQVMLINTSTAEIDYFSIVKDMWAKVGVSLTLDIKDNGTVTSVRNGRTAESMITNTTGPVAIYYVGNPVAGQSAFNLSMIDDPVINDAMSKVRLAAIADQHQAMKIFREQIFKYILPQAYAIPNVIGTYHNLWWPWLKNYSGEITIGYDDSIWPQFIWYDQALKTSMGH